MISSQIQGNVVSVYAPAVYAFYIIQTNKLYPIALVVDSNDTLCGVITKIQLHPNNGDISDKNCGEICNRSFCFLENCENEDLLYSHARNMFAVTETDTLPVVDKNNVPQKMLGRFQAFFLEKYYDLTYSVYARGMFTAARLAKSLGYESITAIEFGVAGGRGLICMGIYGREIEKIIGIKIDVFGFDSGVGLFKAESYRDCPNIWIEGDFKMDFKLLQSKLYNEKLVIGDICNTTKTFLNAPHRFCFC
jgi:hypothetical protein